MDNPMDGVGRVESGTETEQLPRMPIVNPSFTVNQPIF